MFFTKSLLLSFNNNNFFNIFCIPIPKYKEYKIEKVINKSYKFDLDIKKNKKGKFHIFRLFKICYSRNRTTILFNR